MSSKTVIIVSSILSALIGALLVGLDPAAWSLRALAALAGAGTLIGLISLIHANLREQAEEEARDLAGLQVDPAALFNQETQAKVKERTLKQFEKLFLPAFTLVVAVVELLAGVWCYRGAAAATLQPNAGRALMVAVVLLVAAIALYLLGSFVAGLAFRARQGVLRAVAGELVQFAGICGISGVIHLLRLTPEVPSFESLLARAIAAFLVLRACEKGLTVVLDIYRPRAAGGVGTGAGGKVDERLLHESRIASLFAEPKSVMRNLIETLNYQFGFEIGETWFFRLLGRLVPLFLLSQVLILGGFSCIVFVNVGEQAVLERFGKPLAPNPVLQPGMHVKLPWPVDKVYRYRVDRVQELSIGVNPPIDPDEAKRESIARLWTGSDRAAGDLFVTANASAEGSDATAGGTTLNLLSASILVQYRITDVQAWMYASSDTAQLLSLTAKRVVAQYFATHDLNELLGRDRETLNADLLALLRSDVDRSAATHPLGVEILYVGTLNLQPPPAVATAFQDVIAAGENHEEAILAARSEGIRAAASAQIKSETVRSLARGYAYGLTSRAGAEAGRFNALRDMNREYPEQFAERMYLDTLELALKNRKKIVIVARNVDQVITIDLKEKAQTDLLNLQPGK